MDDDEERYIAIQACKMRVLKSVIVIKRTDRNQNSVIRGTLKGYYINTIMEEFCSVWTHVKRVDNYRISEVAHSYK